MGYNDNDRPLELPGTPRERDAFLLRSFIKDDWVANELQNYNTYLLLSAEMLGGDAGLWIQYEVQF